MIFKATLRFFYGHDEQRILYVYTIELNSLFFVSAFAELTNIVNFLHIFNIQFKEWGLSGAYLKI